MSDIPFTHPDAVRDRFAELGRQFVAFKEALETQSPGVKIQMDSAKLFLVVTSYFIDVARYKWWHFGDPDSARLDGTKKASFMAYWLNKLAPVSAQRAPGTVPLVDASGMPCDPSVMANIYFTIFIAMNYLDFMLCDEMTAKLLYHMLWRDEAAKSYMLLFEMLDTASRGDTLFLKKEL